MAYSKNPVSVLLLFIKIMKRDFAQAALIAICIEHFLFVFIQHTGVSCDSCSKANFRGKRFKCLICYDYDLCSTCYENGATTTRHTADHPMQCILTRTDFGKCCIRKLYSE